MSNIDWQLNYQAGEIPFTLVAREKNGIKHEIACQKYDLIRLVEMINALKRDI